MVGIGGAHPVHNEGMARALYEAVGGALLQMAAGPALLGMAVEGVPSYALLDTYVFQDLVQKAVCSVDLNGWMSIIFTRANHKTMRFILDHGSLLIMEGEFRYVRKHGASCRA